MDSKTARNKCKIIGQSLSQFCHLQFDAVESWQSRPLELTDYCKYKTVAQAILINMNFRSI